MVTTTSRARLVETGEEAFALFNSVAVEHSLRLEASISPQETFESMALRHAAVAQELEIAYAPMVIKIAQDLSSLCGKGWERHSSTVEIFGVLAHTTALFGQHPRSEDVGTLILGEDAEPLALGANRVPEGIPLFGAFFADGMRRKHIVCAERIAVGRYLGVTADPPPLADPQYGTLVKESIAKMTDAMHEAASAGPQLENRFVLTTSMPCKTCAGVLTAHKPKAVIAPNGINAHFKCAEESLTVRQEFDASKIPLIPLPSTLTAKGLCA